MKMKVSTLLLFLLLFSSGIFAQIDHFQYKRELHGMSGEWQKIILPEDVFAKADHNLDDIRIFGITATKDTIEAPYILQNTSGTVTEKNINFKIINKAHNQEGYYFSFECPVERTINEMQLNFKQANFNWYVNVEGSQNQKDWFTIVNNYRIVSIKNENTGYQFTKVSFPDSRYRYFRLLVKTQEQPELVSAKLINYQAIPGRFRQYKIRSINIYNDKDSRNTIIDLTLKRPVQVSFIQINVKDTFDYFRPLTIKYLSDSTKTEKGWKYYYSYITSPTLSSVENHEFQFAPIVAQKIRIIVTNDHNEPLNIDSVIVKGYIYVLTARFTKPATYYLAYGNEAAKKPDYDISYFKDKIPHKLTSLELGKEQKIRQKKEVAESEPFFKNKAWLWGIMIVIILLLGWFTVSMMKKQ